MATLTESPAPKPKNPHRVSLRKMAEDAGYSDVLSYIEAECTDSVVPACCIEGCETEPDGRCEHGCPSVLVAAGVI